MYIYNEVDQRLVDDRVTQFRGQMQRFLDGRLSEDDFRPLRLQNGLYVQRQSAGARRRRQSRNSRREASAACSG